MLMRKLFEVYGLYVAVGLICGVISGAIIGASVSERVRVKDSTCAVTESGRGCGCGCGNGNACQCGNHDSCGVSEGN